MGQLKAQGRIEGWRLTWHRLGLGPPGVGKLDLMVEVRDLAQLESAFQLVAGLARGYFAVNSLRQSALCAAHRDCPDPFRHRGEARFLTTDTTKVGWSLRGVRLRDRCTQEIALEPGSSQSRKLPLCRNLCCI
jgi:hypothetical protein